MDIKQIRQNPQQYKKEVEKRKNPELLKAFEEFLSLDKEWRSLKTKADSLRSKRNKISKEINLARKKSKDIKNLIEEAKKIPQELKKIQEKEKEIEKKREKITLLLPNTIDEDVPIGGEEKFEVIEYVGKPKVYDEKNFKEKTPFQKIDHKPLSHYELIEKFNLADTQKASEIAGSRFFIETGKMVFLDLAMILYTLDFFKKQGFEEVIVPPYMIKKEVEKKITHYETFKEAIFHLQEDDLVLITTSEHPIAGIYSNKTLNKKQVPLRILAWSPSFRREAGSHGKDTKGIFRTKQFHKVELHSITSIEQDRKELEFLLEAVKKYMKTLEIPFRVIKVPSAEMDKRARIQYDIETWFPSTNQYRETHSLATMGDWVSRKTNLKIGKEYAANLYSTAVAVQRTICAILENNFDPKTNTIKIPKPLQKYLDFKEIAVEPSKFS